MSVPEDVKRKRRELLDALRSAAEKATPGPSAARSQDFLYGDDGLPVGWDSFLQREDESPAPGSSGEAAKPPGDA